ncbi:hypothetical protein EVAR_4466_1 [Eumeta japonica]|uniref:Uncharacterized protein n=1 Tax=Eumeta variegata TaxID=151549 RepID=A0A4C1T0I9_EUMVA|nr:hypothetical protein EVAR_4466_1 [Eumeta japonica]
MVTVVHGHSQPRKIQQRMYRKRASGLSCAPPRPPPPGIDPALVNPACGRPTNSHTISWFIQRPPPLLKVQGKG